MRRILIHAHTMYAFCMQATLMLHASNTHLHHRCHTCHIRKCAAGMPKTHTVYMLLANHMPHMHACMPHAYYIYYTHTNVMHSEYVYTACMHTIPTYAGYLLLHVYFIQNTFKHFPCMHTLMLHSQHQLHAHFTQAHYPLHACTLYPHMQATCCCMFTSYRTHVNTFHACIH